MDLDIAAFNHVRHEQALTRMKHAMIGCSSAGIIQTAGLLMSLSLLSGWWLCAGLTVFGMSLAVSLTVFVACLTEHMLAGRPVAAITSSSTTTPDGRMELTVNLTTNTLNQPIYTGIYEAHDDDAIAHHRAGAEEAIEQVRAFWLERTDIARHRPDLLILNPAPQPSIEYEWEDSHALDTADVSEADEQTSDHTTLETERTVEQPLTPPLIIPSAAYIPPYKK